MRVYTEERRKEELLCNMKIYQIRHDKDNEIQALLETKAASLARTLELAAQVHEEEVGNLRTAHSRDLAALEFEITKREAEHYKWRQRTALLQIKLGNAQEDVERFKEMTEVLSTQLDIESSARETAQAHANSLHHHLQAVQAQLINAESHVAQLTDLLKTSEARTTSSAADAAATASRAQEQVAILQERVKLAEQTAAAAAERAALAEQTLTSRTANDRIINQDAQALLEVEKKAHSEAEQRADKAERQADKLQAEVSKLQSTLEAKNKRIDGLENALRLKESNTPARDALGVVQALANDLHPSPPTDFAVRANPALLAIPRRRGAAGVGGGGAAAAAATQEVDTTTNDNGEEKQQKKKNKGGRKKKRKNADSDADEEEDDYIPSPIAAKKQRKASKKKASKKQKEEEEENNDDVAGGVEGQEEQMQQVQEEDQAAVAVPSGVTTNKENAADEEEEEEEEEGHRPVNSPQKPPQHQTAAATMQERPLDALNNTVVEAAKGMVSKQPPGPPKPALFKSILSKPAAAATATSSGFGGMGMGGGGGKRQLLGVSSSFSGLGDALPANMLFGTKGFTAPRLAAGQNNNGGGGGGNDNGGK